MWWWGPCAGAACCSDVVLLPSRSDGPALYDELVPLLTDGRRFRLRTNAGLETEDDDSESYADADASTALGLRASASGIAVEPGIYRARDVRTHDPVALKVFDKAMLKHQATRRRLRQEIRVIQQCGDHPNILRLYGVYASQRTFQIAFELARGGEVLHRIAASRSLSSNTTLADSSSSSPSTAQPRYCVTEREIARIIASAASAIQYMHAHGLVHGEIRPEHLLYSDLEPDARVLLVDFGRAAPWRKFTFRSRVHRRQFLWHDRLSLRFLPPAVVQRTPPVDGVPDWAHARQLDVWSLGVTMYVLLCGAFPFDGTSLDEIREQILHQKLEFPKRTRPSQRDTKHTTPHTDDDVRLSRAARDLLVKLLEKDPYASPSIDEVCEHPWLSSDVAPDVRWSDSQIGDFGVFAQRYTRAVAASSLRRPTLDHEAMATVMAMDVSSSSSPQRLGKCDDPVPQHSPLPYEVYGLSGGGPGGSDGDSERDPEDESDDFDAEVERPSFVSTDGNIHMRDSDERPSADAYMRLASAELEALAVRKATAASPSPRRLKSPVPRKSRALAAAGSGESLSSVEGDRPPHQQTTTTGATPKADVWSVFSRPFRSRA